MSQTIFDPKVITGISDLENEIKTNVSNISQVIKKWQSNLKSKCPKEINEIELLLEFNEVFNKSLINDIAKLWLNIFNKYTPTYNSSVNSSIIIFNLNDIITNTKQILKLISGFNFQWDLIDAIPQDIINRAEIFTDINEKSFFNISLNKQQWDNLLKYQKEQMMKIKQYCVEKNNIADKNTLFEFLRKDTDKAKYKRFKALLWSQFSTIQERKLKSSTNINLNIQLQ